MKRKMTACLCGLSMVAVMALPVFATEGGDTPQPGTQERATQLEATVDSSYTLSIPAKTDIVFNATSTDLEGSLKVTGNVLPTEQVTVKAECKPLVDQARPEEAEELAYALHVKDGETVGDKFTEASWNEEELRSESKAISLSVEITEDDWNKAKAGTYEGSIVFTAQLEVVPIP